MNGIDLKGAILNWLLFFALIGVLYWIWRTFSRLAGQHSKVKWQFGLLGIIAFFVGSYVGSLIEKIFVDFILSGALRLPVAILGCWGLYKFLKTRWTKND